MNQQLRVAIIVKALVSKGPVFVAVDIAKGLTKRGHYVIIYYISDHIEWHPEIPHEQISLSRLKILDKFDIIHSHSFWPDFYSVVYSVSCLNFKKSVTTIHNFIAADLRLEYSRVVAYFLEFTWRSVWKYIALKVVLNESMRNYYFDQGCGFNSKVIHNGRGGISIAGEQVDQHPDYSIILEGKIVLGTVCNVIARKGLDQIVKVLPSNDKFLLMIVGDGPELINLKKLAKELNVESQLLLVGHQSNSAPFFRFFDVFLIPSHAEGMPLAMLEAASVGIPIVSSDIPTLVEMFTPDEVSFFMLNDINSLQQSIQYALKGKETFSRNVKLKYDKCYSLDRMADSYINVYLELIK